MVLAGAGAGKTRVIVQRILEIVRRGAAPEEILAITFTNKAAGEMRERVRAALRAELSAEGQREPFVSTFHSLGLCIIKEHFRVFGFKRFPLIYDRADSLRAVKDALKSLDADNEIEPRAALSAISRHKGDGVTAGEYAEEAQTHRDQIIASAWLGYERALAKDNALDFDDLLLRSERFLRENTEARERYLRRWRYVHIDEYQDTNAIQARLAELLVGPQTNICAVGDIDQTIYGWRGAQIANILSFEKKFPGARIIMLEENFRSTKNILAAANDVIVKNIYRREKNLFTKNSDGALLSLYQAFDETDEAAFIARKIREMMTETRARPKDFAVLYRANFQSRAPEEALLAAHIPYQVVGTRFFERKEVKDVLSYIKAALYNSAADVARVANEPTRGIGKVTLLKMLAGRESELTGAVGEKVAAFRLLLKKIEQAVQTKKPSELIPFVAIESGLEQMLKADKLEGAERLENIRELSGLASRYDALPQEEAFQQFLESSALASDQDELKDDADAVRLMTVHASKGLEFKYVFIIGLEEGLFPYERDLGGLDSRSASEEQREEERRLMYVALTRAREKVLLSYASYRTVFGSKNATLPSQFLSDITAELIELEAPERLGRTIYLD